MPEAYASEALTGADNRAVAIDSGSILPVIELTKWEKGLSWWSKSFISFSLISPYVFDNFMTGYRVLAIIFDDINFATASIADLIHISVSPIFSAANLI